MSSDFYSMGFHFHPSLFAFESFPTKTMKEIRILNTRLLKAFTKIRSCITQFSQFGIKTINMNIKRFNNRVYLVDYLLTFSSIFFDTHCSEIHIRSNTFSNEIFLVFGSCALAHQTFSFKLNLFFAHNRAFSMSRPPNFIIFRIS